MDSPASHSPSPTRTPRKDDSGSKSELKSSIPLPAPLCRRDVRPRSSSSCFQKTKFERDKTSTSLFTSIPTSYASARSETSKKLVERPKTASCARNLYSNVKSKIDNTTPGSCFNNQFRSKRPPSRKSNESDNKSIIKTNVDSSTAEESKCRSLPVDPNSIRNEEVILEKQRQLLTIYNELKKLQPSTELKPFEIEICNLMEKKTVSHLEGLSQHNSFLAECAPEFLTTFEKQMREVSELWLQLINDIITSKMAVGKSAIAHLSLPDPSLDLHDEIARFLTNLPTEGEPLHEKLRKIEEEKMRIMTVVMHNVVALTKKHEDLKDENTRLKKTQDEINFQQDEKLSILNEENKELDRKYSLAVNKYNIEKAKNEQQDRTVISINKELMETKKMIKCIEGKCTDIEVKTKKAESAKRTLELALRNMELTLEKEAKHQKELFEKYSQSGEKINKLKYELEETKCIKSSLEESNRDLQMELNNVKVSLEENTQKRNELVEELSNKTKKLNELKEELALLKSSSKGGNYENLDITPDITSNIIVKDLTRDVHQRNIQVLELKKKLHHMENLLKEKASREKTLIKQVNDLSKNRSENDIVLRSQAQELQYKVKDLLREKADLEKMLTQKTLELDQRDLLMKEHAKLVQVRDELIPMIQNKQKNEKECTERLMAIVYENYINHNLDSAYTKIGDQNPYGSIEALERYYGFDPMQVDKELSFRQEKMADMFNLLELKQMEINKLEHRIRELQSTKLRDENVDLGQKMNKSRGFFSMFSAGE